MQEEIQNNDLQLLAIPQLTKKHFFIPDYQRGYRWEEKQVYQLLEDLWKYFKDGIKSRPVSTAYSRLLLRNAPKRLSKSIISHA